MSGDSIWFHVPLGHLCNANAFQKNGRFFIFLLIKAVILTQTCRIYKRHYSIGGGMQHYSAQKVINIFDCDITRSALLHAERNGQIPMSLRQARGSIKARAWPLSSLPAIGERYGFLRPLAEPVALSVFSSKGGVLKSTLAMNIARMAALHGINTCVVGLDIQGDVTKALGFYPDADEESGLADAMAESQPFLGLADLFEDRCALDEIVLATPDLPTLSIVPESAALASVDVGLTLRTKREEWLKSAVVTPLKKRFDLIVMDCSPSWSQVTSNALVASDCLISPLETKINHYRNYTDFKRFLDKFESIMGLEYTKIAVPTRFNPLRKLSVEIRNWYLANVEGCTSVAMRECVMGEEAMCACLAWPEYAPTSVAANEMRDLLREIWSRLPTVASKPLKLAATGS